MTSPSAPSLIRIRNLRFAYPGTSTDILRIPFLDISGRGLIALTGPSGAGKSTLIELLAGTLREPYAGSVVVLDQEWRDLTRDAGRQRHLRRIGLIPQDYGLLTSRTPRQMLAQDLTDAGIDPREHEARIGRALSEMQIGDYTDRLIGTLSGGQRQRVAIARMLARNVDLVIADEPTANLDRELTWQTVEILRRLAAHVPVLVITHEPEVAEACDRTIVLQSATEAADLAAHDLPPRPHRRRVLGIAAAALLLAVTAGGTSWLLTRGHKATPAAATHRLTTAGVQHTAQAVHPTSASPSPLPPTTTHPVTTPPPTTSPPAATVIKYFTPFDLTTGQPAVTVTSRQTGSCFASSLAVNDPNAYRCMTGNEILDPCFLDPDLSQLQLICVYTPWDSGVELTVQQPIPGDAGGTGPTQPTWAYQLANGARCVAITGTGSVVAGIPMDYSCGNGAEAGGLQTAGPLWTMEYLAPHGSTITAVPVTIAWG